MFVEVIADLPKAQVNRPFDYQVPADLEAMVELGMRVEVPFGPRKLMGFIVKIKDQTDFDGPVKSIIRLLDYQSFLNEELVQLSEVLAHKLHSFRISVLQAMLPSMLKVKYETVIQVKDSFALADALNLSPNQFQVQKLDRDWLEQHLPAGRIQQLIKDQVIQWDYRTLDRTRHKSIKYIKPNRSIEAYKDLLDQLPKNSIRQGQVLAYLVDRPLNQAIPLSDLADLAKVNTSVIHNLVKKGWLDIEEREEYRQAFDLSQFKPNQARQLLVQQQNAFDQVKSTMDLDQATTFLLQGVTGSGKTEVYLQLIQTALSKGKTAILLVPEIALTPQMVERVVSRFGQGVAVLHSGLSVSEKYDQWRRIIDQDASVVVGARSSVFAPLKDLGMIIIDEEHETTYKQGDNPRYHARDVAIWRSEYHQCPLVLGSATPSLESRARAQVDHYQLLRIDQRVNQRPLPPVTIVDMTQEEVGRTNIEFSQTLEDQMRQKLQVKEQVVLLLNRRGYASYLLCRSCGQVLQCPHCDISLTYHKWDRSMKCHYCDYHEPVPVNCPHCGSEHLRTQGMGTQKVAESLQKLFPDTPIIRMDNDTTRTKGAHKALLHQFSSQPGSILLGTQMIAKGLDFENVTLVGVINADTGLNLPDFRAGEKTFQLLTQVAGRTGRGALSGQVIIQTYNPDHYVIQLAKSHDYDAFFFYEMKRRHLANYPPYYFTTLIKVSSKKRGLAQKTIYQVKEDLMQRIPQATSVIVLGPSTGGIERINDYYHYQLLIKYKQAQLIQSQLDQVLELSQEIQNQGVFIQIDHEPQYFI